MGSRTPWVARPENRRAWLGVTSRPSLRSGRATRRASSAQRSGFTWKELLAVIFVIGLLLAMLIPWVGNAREAARRMWCANQTMQIGLALHNYAQTSRCFPPGTICTTEPIAPHGQYDVWGEAAKTDKGNDSTSFLLRILPYIECQSIFNKWDFGYGIGRNARTQSDPGPAVCNIESFYCPTRRNGLRPKTTQ